MAAATQAISRICITCFRFHISFKGEHGTNALCEDGVILVYSFVCDPGPDRVKSDSEHIPELPDRHLIPPSYHWRGVDVERRCSGPLTINTSLREFSQSMQEP